MVKMLLIHDAVKPNNFSIWIINHSHPHSGLKEKISSILFPHYFVVLQKVL